MDRVMLTNRQARQFILVKQGLLGDYRFSGKEGVLDFVHQAGCIQFDPIDVCGKNAELVLQSRIKGFTKRMLYELLYEDRRLLDYYDKNLAILAIEDWPYLERIREYFRKKSRSNEEVDKITDEIKQIIIEKSPVSSKDIGYEEKVDWYWNSTKLARAALETLYFRGELIVHHKIGTNKYYALAKDYVPEELLMAKDPKDKELEHLKWRVLRRISALGLLWNKPSDAFLFIWNMNAKVRNQVFTELLQEGEITEVVVEGCKDSFYCISKDLPLLHQVMGTSKFKSRTELIAPLDNMLWDRKIIKVLFGFEYKWEIYTPMEQRKYGYYVLPILSGERFIGRCETVKTVNKKQLEVRHIWLEDEVKPSKKLEEELDRCLRRFMKFHELEEIIYLDHFKP